MHYVVTLVERDFLFGAAVLYNSLIRCGFDEGFIIGHRGTVGMPTDLVARMQNSSALPCPIDFVEVETKHHFANFKPRFIRGIINAKSESQKVTYIDPDIVACCVWSWMSSWCDNGPVAFGDVKWRVPANHPLRYQWREILSVNGIPQRHSLDMYFNSGFASVTRKDIGFMDLWISALDIADRMRARLVAHGDIGSWKDGGREKPFHIPDQDTFNMALTAWDGGLVTFGPDAMGFTAGEKIIPHAIGGAKPWRKNYLKEALRGNAPRLVDKVFWANALTPIPIASAASIRFKRMSISLASSLGRIYRRR